jgi:hypothetical protein
VSTSGRPARSVGQTVEPAVEAVLKQCRPRSVDRPAVRLAGTASHRPVAAPRLPLRRGQRCCRVVDSFDQLERVDADAAGRHEPAVVQVELIADPPDAGCEVQLRRFVTLQDR